MRAIKLYHHQNRLSDVLNPKECFKLNNRLQTNETMYDSTDRLFYCFVAILKAGNEAKCRP